jgi:hypothetical protein
MELDVIIDKLNYVLFNTYMSKEDFEQLKNKVDDDNDDDNYIDISLADEYNIPFKLDPYYTYIMIKADYLLEAFNKVNDLLEYYIRPMNIYVGHIGDIRRLEYCISEDIRYLYIEYDIEYG